jgi:hypothetical protein
MVEIYRGLSQSDHPARYAPRFGADYYEAHLAWNLANLLDHGRRFLVCLPLSETVEVAPGHRLFACHASPHDPANRVCGPDNPAEVLREAFGSVKADVIAFGHSHTPSVRLLDGRLMVNVASVAYRSDATSVLTMITYQEEQWIVQKHHVHYDADKEAGLMKERGVPIPRTD